MPTGVDWRRQLGGIRSVMDQSQAPPLDALADYHRSGSYGFSPPAVLDCLRSGVGAGMTIPDPTDRTAQKFRVVAWHKTEDGRRRCGCVAVR